MANKKKYYSLDDIGFIGTQEKRSPAEWDAIIKKTGEIIRERKAAEAAKAKRRVKKAS